MKTIDFTIILDDGNNDDIVNVSVDVDDITTGQNLLRSVIDGIRQKLTNTEGVSDVTVVW